MEAVWKEVQPLERVLRACWFMDSDGFMVTKGWAASEWFPQCAIQTPSDCMTSGGRCMPTVLSRQLLNGLGAKIQYRKLQVSVMLACMKFLEWTIHGSLTQHQTQPFQQRWYRNITSTSQVTTAASTIVTMPHLSPTVATTLGECHWTP